MSTLQIGSRLVRPLTNGRNAITEVIDGKHFIKILDADGKTIQQRVKKFDTTAVGDKFVKTKTQVVQDGGAPFKGVSQRVYDNDKNLVAVKHTSLRRNGQPEVEHVLTNDGKWIRTRFDENSGVRFNRDYFSLYSGVNIGTSKLDISKDAILNQTLWYEKGLPMPTCSHEEEYELLKDMSLAQRRTYWQDKHPDLSYTNVPSLKSLDDKVAGTKINNLDELL